jgi:hypothetical protein
LKQSCDLAPQKPPETIAVLYVEIVIIVHPAPLPSTSATVVKSTSCKRKTPDFCLSQCANSTCSNESEPSKSHAPHGVRYGLPPAKMRLDLCNLILATQI